MKKVFLTIALIAGISASAQTFRIVTKQQIGKMMVSTINENDVISNSIEFMPSDYMKIEMRMNDNGDIRPIPVGKMKIDLTNKEYNELTSMIRRMVEAPINSYIRMQGPMTIELVKNFNSDAINLEYSGKYITLYRNSLTKLLNK